MRLLANIAVAIVALLHVCFLVLEMFLWTKPFGRRVFGLSAEIAEASRALAANQGLYNGFLAAGLVWGLVAHDAALSIRIFFLGCVIVAGVF
jgi:putative membrane protein